MMLSVVLAQEDGAEKIDTLVRTRVGTDYYCGRVVYTAVDSTLVIRVGVSTEYYCGRLIYTGIGSVEVVKNGRAVHDTGLPAGFEVEVRVHKWNNIDFATWDRDFGWCGGSLVVFQGDYDGIYVIDVLLYKYGTLIDAKHIVYNFQEESYKLRFI